ncbi:MAG: hypothetical protein U0359_03885 [Byssovorax sp.]
MKTQARLALPLLLALAACGQAATPPGDPTASVKTIESAPAPRSPLGSAPILPSASAPASSVQTPAPPASAFAEVVGAISEPDGPFISDNAISNETSYLQVAGALSKLGAPGGAYIGVGPEQNFTYIALTRPSVAFIVDIRRQNMILHLLYKAIFTEAQSRTHFLSLLLGRSYDASREPAQDASIEDVIAAVEKGEPDKAGFAALHARLRERIEKEIHLDAGDRKTLEVAHRSFLDKQLALRFELHEKNGRVYPTLRELFTQRDPDGKARGFLAEDASFRFVQTMEREGRILPVVGDFAGDRAMPGIAAEIKKRGLTVSAFYVSNVEQYLFEPGVWTKWARNVASLPVDDRSLFIRCYLDQGKRHPQEMKGHRTATVLQKIADFDERQAKKPFTSWWSVATEKVLGENGLPL